MAAVSRNQALSFVTTINALTESLPPNLKQKAGSNAQFKKSVKKLFLPDERSVAEIDHTMSFMHRNKQF